MERLALAAIALACRTLITARVLNTLDLSSGGWVTGLIRTGFVGKRREVVCSIDSSLKHLAASILGDRTPPNHPPLPF